MSFCGPRQGSQEIDRTRSDAGLHYSRSVRFIEEKRRKEEQLRKQQIQLPEAPQEPPPEIPSKNKPASQASQQSNAGGQCTLKRSKDSDSCQDHNMEIYAASAAALIEQEYSQLRKQQEVAGVQSQETKSESSSNESGFDERRDSSTSQDQIPRVNPEELYEKVNKKIKTKKDPHQEEEVHTTLEVVRDLPETYVQATPQITKEATSQITKEATHCAETLTLVSDRKLTATELNNEINKFMASSKNVTNGEQTFYEEEYSYEPESDQSSTKLVLRTRSLMNLNDAKSGPGVVRPAGMRSKITTGPDGGFVIGGRKANSEMNLSDESNETSPKCGRLFAGDELRKRREEIIKKITAPWPPQDSSKFYEEINQGNGRTTKEIAINSLKKYLSDNKIALKELLTNRNVVIVEPFRTSKQSIDVSEYNHKNAKFEGCRITGAISKEDLANNNEACNTLPRAAKPHQASVQRHYFYHLIKSKTDPKEEELPDPDTVRNTRERFQKELKLVGPEEKEVKDIMLPIAAKIITPHKENLNKPKTTPEVRIINDTRRKESPDFKKTKKWTDSGSLSSGVSSDLSCNENDFDNNLDEESHKEYSSDEDESRNDLKEAHPISPEVMKKIRACGTTVTYYGGRIISHSYGPSVRSPMTMTIMDEIKQGYEMPRKVKDQSVGIKFRLIKSNSCGSRLELAGTDDDHRMRNNHFHNEEGKSLSEELAECRERMEPIEDMDEQDDNSDTLLRPSQQERNIRVLNNQKPCKGSNDTELSWRALIESRKQNKAMELRRIHIDMEFEEFQVAE